MSRIGRAPIAIPAGVDVTLEGNVITVKGPKGTLTRTLNPELTYEVEGGEIKVTRPNDEKYLRSIHGLNRTLIANMVKGVTDGYQKPLEINGVGFRLSGGGKQIEMALGFSHPVKYAAPEGIELKVDKMTITVIGINKQKVGQVAAEIRSLKKPEPYKGKGIKYADEVILRKAGKAGKK